MARSRRAAATARRWRSTSPTPASFAAFAAALRRELPHGTVDILVNNAGTALYSALDSTTEADFDQVFDVHVKGPFFLTQTLLPLIANGGHIVNISSALTRVSFAGSGPYASAKAALEMLTRYQALEFGSRGITVNVIAAGAVPTDFGDGHLRGDAALQETVVQATAVGRLATPDDIGEAIAGLTTASGRWITGQRIETQAACASDARAHLPGQLAAGIRPRHRERRHGSRCHGRSRRCLLGEPGPAGLFRLSDEAAPHRHVLK